jgi:hypothetical protein
VGRRAVRRRLGKPGRRYWTVYRLTLVAADSWDSWLGELSLTGVDPRGWDLNQLLAAFEATLRRNAKDDAEWRRVSAQLTAEPKEAREKRRQQAASGRAAPAGGGLTEDAAQALMARFAAADAMYG